MAFVKENPRIIAAADELRKTGAKVGDAVSEALKSMEESEVMRVVSFSYVHRTTDIYSNISSYRFHELRLLCPTRSPQPLSPSEIQRLTKPFQKRLSTHWTTVGVQNMLVLRRKKRVGGDGSCALQKRGRGEG